MSALPRSSDEASFKIDTIEVGVGVVANDIAAVEDDVLHTSRRSIVKRGMDVLVSSLAILFMLPLLAFIFVVIRLQDGETSLFVQERIGADGKSFKCFKFRTMVSDAEARLKSVLANDPQARMEWESMRKLTVDPRITWLGHFLRKTSLDELPQLFNVLRGEMSLVGPRPIVDAEIALYGEDYASYTSMRPGISGLWQISGRSDVSFERRVQFDKQYNEEWSILFDLEIIARTIPALLAQSGAR